MAEDAAKKAAEATAKKEAQEVAKKEADELLARDHALAAAKEKPTPAQVKAAALESRARDTRNAATRPRRSREAPWYAIAAKQKAIAEQIKAREDAKLAADKARQEAADKGAKVRAEAAAAKSRSTPLPTSCRPSRNRRYTADYRPDAERRKALLPYVRPVSITSQE